MAFQRVTNWTSNHRTCLPLLSAAKRPPVKEVRMLNCQASNIISILVVVTAEAVVLTEKETMKKPVVEEKTPN